MKQSLFKLKIKQAKAAKQKQQGKHQDSFPEAIKIDLSPTQFQPAVQNVSQNNFKSSPQTNGILHNCYSLVTKEQMSKIQQQNNKLINNMSEQQILKLRDSLLSQMPKGFVAKLLKSVHNQQSVSTKQNLQKNPTLVQNQQQKISQQQETEPAQAEVNAKKQESQKQFMDSLFIDIQTGQILAHTESNIFTKQNEERKKDKYIVLGQLHIMAQSQNNQTQAVAAQIVTKITKKLKQYGKIIKNKGVILHKVVITELFYQRVIRTLISKAETCKFKSVWVQLICCLCQITQSFWRLLPQQLQAKVQNTLQKSLKNRKFEQVQIIQQKIKETLKNIIQLQSESLQKQFNLAIDLQNIDEIIELISLQQSHFQMGILDEKFTYLTQLAKYYKNCLSKIVTAEQLTIMIELIFSIIWKLKMTLNTPILMRLKDNIYKFLKQFALQLFTKEIFQKETGKFKFNLNQINLKCLYGIKQMDPQFFDEFIKQFNSGNVSILNQNEKYQILAFLMAFNLQKYRQQPLEGIQQTNNMILLIQNLTKMFNQKVMQLPAQIFIHELLFVYQNNNSIYNQQSVKQPIDTLLEKLFKEIDKNALKLIVPVQRLKILIERYNFSSFGSNSFTKIIFLLSTIQQDYQHLVLEQVISRYLFLFYYATEESGVYCFNTEYKLQQLYRSTYQRQEKLQLSEILQRDPQINKNNIFYTYLTK